MLSSLKPGTLPMIPVDDSSYWDEALTLFQRLLYQRGASADVIRSTTRVLKKRKQARCLNPILSDGSRVPF